MRERIRSGQAALMDWFYKGEDEDIDRAALPAFEGETSQLVHLDDVEERVRPHPLTPDAIRFQRGIDEAAGLQRQACAWVRLESGVESTTFHTHAGLCAGRQPRNPAALSGAQAARERRQYLLRQPHCG